MGRRASGPFVPLAAVLAGCCCALVFLGTPPEEQRRGGTAELLSVEAARLGAGITGELFGHSARQQQHQHRLMAALRQRRRDYRAGVSSPTMILAEGEDGGAGKDGSSQDADLAHYVWRKERLEKDWGVNVDNWLDPDLLDRIDYSDHPYTAGHHPQDENITNATSQFFADDWPKWNETSNSTWIDDEDFRWNSPYDYVGARPLEVDHHHPIDHHHIKFLPGVNVNSNPLCGQNLDGSPRDCGDSEWFV